MRIGLFGGSFDPVHYGHLLLAEFCREEVPLDEVWFVPAAVSPHKTDQEPASATDRLEMLKLAVAGHEAFRVDAEEIERGGVSYTVDTLAGLHENQSDCELFFLMGADSLASFPKWHEPARICELATLVVVDRAGDPPADFSALEEICTPSQLEAIRAHHVRMALVDFSSSAIRERVAAGKSIRYQTPRAVEKYIQTHGLYRSASHPPE